MGIQEDEELSIDHSIRGSKGHRLDSMELISDLERSTRPTQIKSSLECALQLMEEIDMYKLIYLK